MRDNVLNAWKELIDRSVHNEFPLFELYSKRVRGEDRGMRKFVWRASGNLWFFIAFRPIASEAFDAWVGWSTKGRCPYTFVKYNREADLSNLELSEMMVSSMDLVPRSGIAHWNFWNPTDKAVDDPQIFATEYTEHFGKDLSIEEAKELVAPAVNKGVKEVKDYGIPYLKRRLELESKKQNQ